MHIYTCITNVTLVFEITTFSLKVVFLLCENICEMSLLLSLNIKLKFSDKRLHNNYTGCAKKKERHFKYT